MRQIIFVKQFSSFADSKNALQIVATWKVKRMLRGIWDTHIKNFASFYNVKNNNENKFLEFAIIAFFTSLNLSVYFWKWGTNLFIKFLQPKFIKTRKIWRYVVSRYQTLQLNLIRCQMSATYQIYIKYFWVIHALEISFYINFPGTIIFLSWNIS